MNTKATIAIIAVLTVIFTFFTVKKMKANAQRAYKVITWDEFNLCFLVAPEYKIVKTSDAFKYTAGKNSGEFTLRSGQVDPAMKKSFFGDFEGAYSKEVDFRTFEYKISENVVLRDKFDFAKKNFPNLLPVRSNCSKYLERFPILLRL